MHIKSPSSSCRVTSSDAGRKQSPCSQPVQIGGVTGTVRNDRGVTGTVRNDRGVTGTVRNDRGVTGTVRNDRGVSVRFARLSQWLQNV